MTTVRGGVALSIVLAFAATACRFTPAGEPTKSKGGAAGTGDSKQGEGDQQKAIDSGLDGQGFWLGHGNVSYVPGHRKVSRFLIQLLDQGDMPVVGAKVTLARLEVATGVGIAGSASVSIGSHGSVQISHGKRFAKKFKVDVANPQSNVFTLVIGAGQHYQLLASARGFAPTLKSIVFESGRPVEVSFPVRLGSTSTVDPELPCWFDDSTGVNPIDPFVPECLDTLPDTLPSVDGLDGIGGLDGGIADGTDVFIDGESFPDDIGVIDPFLPGVVDPLLPAPGKTAMPLRFCDRRSGDHLADMAGLRMILLSNVPTSVAGMSVLRSALDAGYQIVDCQSQYPNATLQLSTASGQTRTVTLSGALQYLGDYLYDSP